MTTKIKSSQIKMFLNTTPLTTATYSLIGDGVKSLKVNFNPKTTEETYVHQDGASISVDSYAPTVPVEMTAKAGDAAFEFIDSLRKARAVLADAETDVVSVWLYETATAGEYPAEKQAISIQIDDLTIEGGVPVKINYTINYIGDPVLGTFNPVSKVFTPNPNTATLSLLTIGALTLSPTFSSSQLWYVTSTSVSPQTVSATATDNGATVTITNGVTEVDTGTGSASGAATLASGANTITIEVDDGVEIATYTVIVTKT